MKRQTGSLSYGFDSVVYCCETSERAELKQFAGDVGKFGAFSFFKRDVAV